MKRTIDVEKLLQWAYRDELPKQGASSTTGYDHGPFGLGTRIDECRLPAILGDPHPDSRVIERAVNGLARMALDWRSSRAWIMGEDAALLSDADPVLRVLDPWPAPLVMQHARMGTRPDWAACRFRPRRIQGPNGRPVVEGALANGRYAPGAACPLEYEPSPRAVAEQRIDYAAWHGALICLVEVLELSSWVPIRPAAPAAPWLTGPQPEPNILYDVTVSAPPSTGRRARAAGA